MRDETYICEWARQWRTDTGDDEATTAALVEDALRVAREDHAGDIRAVLVRCHRCGACCIDVAAGLPYDGEAHDVRGYLRHHSVVWACEDCADEIVEEAE